ncbi:MAG: VWA domain-containing protein [bacterium]
MIPNSSDLAHPEVLDWLPWLGALALLHLLSILQRWWWQRSQFRAPALKRFGPGLSLWRGLLKWGLWTVAAWELVLALAVPLGPPLKIAGKQYGADVVFCLDVSSSMLAQDVQPNRLGAAKGALDAILNNMDGDRVGLVGFAGSAVVACPLTTDYDTAELFLDKLDVDSVPRDGTDLASAIQMALDGFGTDSARGKLIVLATDGEDTVNSAVLTEAQRARELGVAIECVGVGTQAGALIPGQRDLFGRVYAKLWHGQPVRTRLDRSALESIAKASGGEYLDGGSPAALKRVVSRIQRLKQGLGKAPDRYVRDPLYQIPLLWAFALLLADSLISLRGRGWLRLGERLTHFLARRWSPNRALVLLLGLLALAVSAHADLDKGRSIYNEGNDAYRSGDYAASASDYGQAVLESKGSLTEASDYNLGNALFQQRDYHRAIAAYDQALKLNPNDQDAQYNRNLAQEMLDRKNKKPNNKDKKKDSQKNNKNENGGQNQQGQGQGQQNQGQQSQGQNQQGQGRNQQGQGQQSQNQQGQGQNQQAGGDQTGGQQGQSSAPQGPPGPRLSRDQIETMLNQLRLDQHKYEGAFNPLKHYGRPDQQSQNPMQQMLQQFTGVPMQPQQPPQAAEDPNYKDW